MTPVLDDWMSFYRILRTDCLAPAAARALSKGRVTNSDLEVFSMMDGLVNQWRRQKAEAD